MQNVTVRALRTFHYAGRDHHRGADVSMTPIDAAAHARKGHVTLARQFPPRASKPAINQQAAAVSALRDRREAAAPVVDPIEPAPSVEMPATEPEQPEQEIDPSIAQRRTRRYRRRDLTAEDPNAG